MINRGILYVNLRNAAHNREIIAYSELSARYLEETGEEHHPRGTWDVPLGELNGFTHAA